MQRGSGSKPIQKAGKFNNFKKRQQKQQEEESEVDSEEEFNRVMQEEDPELEKDLLGEDGAIAAEDEDIQMEDGGDEGEFVDDGGDLDLPDEEEVEDNEDDLKGEDTDSDLEEYYRELGIETDEKDQAYKKKSKKAKKPQA